MTNVARFSGSLAALALAAVLAGCGGGGGGGDGGGGVTAPPPATAVQSVAITLANGRAVAADAAANVSDIGAARSGTSLITGVQVQETKRSASPQMLAGVIRSVAALVPAQSSTVTGVAISETVQCTLGGSLTITGNVASDSQLTSGDNLSLNASNCRENVDGTSATLNGGLALTIAGGRIGSGTFDVTIDARFTAFTVQTAGVTAVAEGDMHMLWTYAGASSQTLVINGTAFTNSVTEGGVTRSSTWRNYRQSVTLAGDNVDSTLECNVEAKSPALGGTTVAYRVSGSFRTVASTGRVVAGSVSVEGANSRLLLSVVSGTPDTFTLQIDAQGDGTYETTIQVTRAELEALT